MNCISRCHIAFYIDKGWKEGGGGFRSLWKNFIGFQPMISLLTIII